MQKSKHLLHGNPLIIEKTQLDVDVSKLKLLKQSYLSEIYRLEDMIAKYYPNRIKQLEKMLENASIITDVSTDKVGIGNTVSIKYVGDEEEDEYKIVGSQEADPFESKISNESPIAQALFDHKVGDIVTVESPNGSYQVEIIEIK